MNIYEIMLLPLFAVVMLILPVVYILKKKKSNSAAKTAFVVNICSFFAVLALGIILPVGGFVNAEAVETVNDVIGNAGLGYLAAALSTGLATIGAGIAVAVAGSAALGAISEDSKLLGKTLIFVGLAEGIAIYGLIISIMIINKV